MKTLKSEFSWSFSRYRLFSECKRAYFYHYYASWGGWDKTADEFRRKAYVLKNLRNLDAWIGDIVHQVIKWILEERISNNPVSSDQARAKAKKLLQWTWEQSRSRMWLKNVKHNLNLFEHYYERELSQEVLALKLKKVTKSLNNIYDSGFLESLSQLPKESFLRIDELDSFNFRGLKSFAVPDFSLHRDQGYLLYDWKTGKRSDKDILQLSCYQLYAINKWKAPIDQIKVIPVYLAEEKICLEPIKALKIKEVEEYIQDSVDQMKSVLFSLSENKADIDHCPKTDLSWRCRNCKFQEICS